MGCSHHRDLIIVTTEGRRCPISKSRCSLQNFTNKLPTSHSGRRNFNKIKDFCENFIISSGIILNQRLTNMHSPRRSRIKLQLVVQHLESLERDLQVLQGLPPRLVIFDFDGTLFDSRASVVYCMRKTVNNLLLDEVPLSVEEKIEDLIELVWSSSPPY